MNGKQKKQVLVSTVVYKEELESENTENPDNTSKIARRHWVIKYAVSNLMRK